MTFKNSVISNWKMNEVKSIFDDKICANIKMESLWTILSIQDYKHLTLSGTKP